MAKNTRSKGKKVKEDDKGREFLDALQELAAERGIAAGVLFEAIREALKAAYRRNYNQAQNVRVDLDELTGRCHVYSIKTIVADDKKDFNPVEEIKLTGAQKINPDYQEGDSVEQEVVIAGISRIAAQAAKQMVVQRVREAERINIFEEFVSRSGDIITGTVRRVENKNIFVDLGRAEGCLPQGEQIAGEEYFNGDRIKTYITEIKKTSKNPQIVLSRTHPGLLKRLFELEVPEIQEGIVEIKSVAREPGMRSKIAVASNDADVDAVGACVGQKGARVQNVVDELRNEKIDIVKWNDDPARYIANALSPAKVVSVAVNLEEKMSRVVVPDYQLSLAIGKEGQNARLAAKLTGWKIDIKSESQAAGDELDENMDIVEVTGEESFSAEGE